MKAKWHLSYEGVISFKKNCHRQQARSGNQMVRHRDYFTLFFRPVPVVLLFGSGANPLICCSDFANLKDLPNHVHSSDPLPIIQ
jgi:hypothetical protein